MTVIADLLMNVPDHGVVTYELVRLGPPRTVGDAFRAVCVYFTNIVSLFILFIILELHGV